MSPSIRFGGDEITVFGPKYGLLKNKPTWKNKVDILHLDYEALIAGLDVRHLEDLPDAVKQSAFFNTRECKTYTVSSFADAMEFLGCTDMRGAVDVLVCLNYYMVAHHSDSGCMVRQDYSHYHLVPFKRVAR